MLMRNGVILVPEIRYQENGDNRLLRDVLVGLWDRQCYWCREFKGYTDLQIDHILPKTADKSMRDSLRHEFRLEANYDVHAPYNLAPICGMCNQQKGSADLTKYGVVLTSLQKAKKFAPEVAQRVESFGAGFNLADALLHVVEAVLTDGSTRETFEREAPAVVQRLAELGEGKADFYTFRTPPRLRQCGCGAGCGPRTIQRDRDTRSRGPGRRMRCCCLCG
jgi:5-methylcytosine-specific restriction endonuclease McrA